MIVCVSGAPSMLLFLPAPNLYLVNVQFTKTEKKNLILQIKNRIVGESKSKNWIKLREAEHTEMSYGKKMAAHKPLEVASTSTLKLI